MPRADDDAAPGRRPRLPVIAVVFLGGCVGGYARYAVTTAWHTRSGSFPISTLVVNVVGAFMLALVVVLASELRHSAYLRPLLGTGFCGAFTTFSSVVVTVDQLLAHDHPATAGWYLAATIGFGLGVATVGLNLARALTRHRRADRPEPGR